MATIISPGRKPEPPTPWYLKAPVTCPQCGCVFQLGARDFDLKVVGGIDRDPDWQVIATARTPNGEQLIEGPCPDCHKTVRITGRMGGLPTIGGSVTIGGTTYNKRDMAERPLNGGY
jgi:hypothetical protein